MTDKPYTDADVEQLTALVRARVGWPISAGEAGTIVTVVLEELTATGRLATDDDPRHIIEFRPDGWTIKHPLSCRIGDLFGCRVNEAAEDLDGPPVPLGRYEATVSDIDGRLQIGDRVEHLTPSEYDPADDEDAQAAVQNLLDDATRAFAAAGTSSERVEVIRDLLAGWYAAWPSTAVTDPNEGIAWQLASLISAAEARASERQQAPDHPHTDPSDGRTECERCGKWVWPVIHSCKGLPVTERARARHIGDRVDQAEG